MLSYGINVADYLSFDLSVIHNAKSVSTYPDMNKGQLPCPLVVSVAYC